MIYYHSWNVIIIQYYLDLAKPDVKDVRAELRRFGNENPQVKFKEELKIREINM